MDFVRGLLTINPLERWSPQQAKLHPFITQQKFTGPFVPPMNLKSSSLNRSPAPGTQQQQQAEQLSKQRAQAAQAQANSAAQSAYQMAQAPYQQPPPSHAQAPPIYPNSATMYSPGGSHSAGAPPPYAAQPNPYGQMAMGQVPVQMPPAHYAGSAAAAAAGGPGGGGMYSSQQAAARSRQRASTMDQQQSGIPAAIQRVASHLDPSQPIRLQPSPAYYPPPHDGPGGLMMDQGSAAGRGPVLAGRRGSRAGAVAGGTQQGSRAGGNHDFIRNLEERTLEEGFMGGQNPWH